MEIEKSRELVELECSIQWRIRRKPAKDLQKRNNG